LLAEFFIRGKRSIVELAGLVENKTINSADARAGGAARRSPR
jgi:hypothetical protein